MASTSQARSLITTLIPNNTAFQVSASDMRDVLFGICDVMDSLGAENFILPTLGYVEQIDFAVIEPRNTTLSGRMALRLYNHYDIALTDLRVDVANATVTFAVTVYVDGTPVGGMTDIPVFSGSRFNAHAATNLNGVPAGSQVRLGISGVTGTPYMLAGSVRATRGLADAIAETWNAELSWFHADVRDGVVEGTIASTTVGTVVVNNTNQFQAATWQIISQADSPALFYIMSQGNTSANIGIQRAWPTWTSLSHAHSFTIRCTKGTDSKDRTFEVMSLRNGVHPRLYPLDGVTRYNNQKGRITELSARGSSENSASYTIVGNANFTMSANMLVQVATLSASIYTVNIQVSNGFGTTSFVRTVTVQNKATAEVNFPWWLKVQAGPDIPARQTALPQTIRFANESASLSVSASEYVHFKLSFGPGDVSLNERPIFIFTTSATITAQIDDVSYWRDDVGNINGLRCATFLLKSPTGFAPSEVKAVTVSKQVGTLSTTAARSLSASKTIIAGQNWQVKAKLDSISYTAALSLGAMNDARARIYARGQHGDGIHCVTKFVSDVDSTQHASIAVHWYAHAYDDGRVECMPVVHNTWMQTISVVNVQSMATWRAGAPQNSWMPASFTQYGRTFGTYAGDQKARALRSDGTANMLYARYDAMLRYLAEAGTFHNYMPTMGALINVPSPGDPSHVPGSTAKFHADPNQADGLIAGGTNYGSALAPQPDWSVKALVTGSAAWLNVMRCLAADWGIYPHGYTDESTWEIRAANEGWAGGTQNTGRYPGITATPFWFRTSFPTLGVLIGVSGWDEQHAADPYFTLAFVTGRQWWLDAKVQIANHYAVWQPGGPGSGDYGYRLHKLSNGSTYFVGGAHWAGSSNAEREMAWCLKHYSDAEWLLGESDLRYPVFRDYHSDPYLAHYHHHVSDFAVTDNDGNFHRHNRFRRLGWHFQRPDGWQPWEADYLASTLCIDVLRRRFASRTHVRGMACYLLPTLTFGRGAPEADGGAGCRHYATANFLSPMAFSDRIMADSWSEMCIERIWADYLLLPFAPKPVPIVNGFKKWFGGNYSACLTGSARDAGGGFTDGTRPTFARASAINGVNAGIPNASAFLATIQAMVNYTNAASYYANQYERWGVET